MMSVVKRMTCCNQDTLPACHLLVCHQNDGDDHGHDLCACYASFHHGGPHDNGLTIIMVTMMVSIIMIIAIIAIIAITIAVTAMVMMVSGRTRFASVGLV